MRPATRARVALLCVALVAWAAGAAAADDTTPTPTTTDPVSTVVTISVPTTTAAAPVPKPDPAPSQTRSRPVPRRAAPRPVVVHPVVPAYTPPPAAPQPTSQPPVLPTRISHPHHPAAVKKRRKSTHTSRHAPRKHIPARRHVRAHVHVVPKPAHPRAVKHTHTTPAVVAPVVPVEQPTHGGSNLFAAALLALLIGVILGTVAALRWRRRSPVPAAAAPLPELAPALAALAAGQALHAVAVEPEPIVAAPEPTACSIELWRGYVRSQFLALVDRAPVAESPPFKWRSDGPPPNTGEPAAALDALVATLAELGWAASDRGEHWYELRFERAAVAPVSR